MCWFKKFRGSTEVYVVKNIADQSTAKIVFQMRGLGKREGWLQNCIVFCITDSTSKKNEDYQLLFQLIDVSLRDELVPTTQNFSMVQNQFFTYNTFNPDRAVAVAKPTDNFWVFGFICISY